MSWFNRFLGLFGFEIREIQVKEIPDGLASAMQGKLDSAVFDMEFEDFVLKHIYDLSLDERTIMVGDQHWSAWLQWPKGSWTKTNGDLHRNPDAKPIGAHLSCSGSDPYQRLKMSRSEFLAKYGIDPLQVLQHRLTLKGELEGVRIAAQEVQALRG